MNFSVKDNGLLSRGGKGLGDRPEGPVGGTLFPLPGGLEWSRGLSSFPSDPPRQGTKGELVKKGTVLHIMYVFQKRGRKKAKKGKEEKGELGKMEATRL